MSFANLFLMPTRYESGESLPVQSIKHFFQQAMSQGVAIYHKSVDDSSIKLSKIIIKKM